MQNTASLEALHVNVKSFELSHAIIKSNLFSKIAIKPVSRLILLTVSGMYNPRLGYSFPSVRKLSACTGYTDRQIKEGLKELSLSGMIIRTDKKIYFTNKFYELLDLNKDENNSRQNEKSSSKSEVSSPPCHEHVIKQDNKQKKEQSFIFKNLLELSKTNTIAYYQSTLNLSESEKEHICKIKLGRMALTNFQKQNIDKLIMLNEYEINKINSLEPYFKQENINIYYNTRMNKIREYQQDPQEQENKLSVSERESNLLMLSCGYKGFKDNRMKLTDFLNRNKNKMDKFNITESDLLTRISI